MYTHTCIADSTTIALLKVTQGQFLKYAAFKREREYQLLKDTTSFDK